MDIVKVEGINLITSNLCLLLYFVPLKRRFLHLFNDVKMDIYL